MCWFRSDDYDTVYCNIIHRELLFGILKILYRWWWFIFVWVCGDVYYGIGSVLCDLSHLTCGDTCINICTIKAVNMLLSPAYVQGQECTHGVTYITQIGFGFGFTAAEPASCGNSQPTILYIKEYPNSFWMAFWCKKEVNCTIPSKNLIAEISSAILVVQYSVGTFVYPYNPDVECCTDGAIWKWCCLISPLRVKKFCVLCQSELGARFWNSSTCAHEHDMQMSFNTRSSVMSLRVCYRFTSWRCSWCRIIVRPIKRLLAFGSHQFSKSQAEPYSLYADDDDIIWLHVLAHI